MYEVPPDKYSAEQIIHISLDPQIDDKKICKQRPLHIELSSTFVVNLNSIKDPDIADLAHLMLSGSSIIFAAYIVSTQLTATSKECCPS